MIANIAVEVDAIGSHSSSFVDLSRDAEAEFIAGARDSARVSGFTHAYYKYPARFGPTFVRSAIKAFTQPGDLVIDNHVGGGTTLVEALALGRNAVGVDISTLAAFVARVKTTVLSHSELTLLQEWILDLGRAINLRKTSTELKSYRKLGYYKHLDVPARWRLRKAIEQGLISAMKLKNQRMVDFGRCVVLKTAQWALDGRRLLPSISEFRNTLIRNASDMVDAARLFSETVLSNSQKPKVHVLNRTSIGLEKDKRLQNKQTPSLVITSPPYPGVHVLYHRWQVDGRKETPLPFMIANKLDGAGGSYYTMGDRKYSRLKTYFDNVSSSMASVAELCDEDTTFIQMVAFSDPVWQLPRYLQVMEDAGLTEFFLPSLEGSGDGRLWREVPGRRWYSEQKGKTPGSTEVVLIHRKRRN